MLVEAVTNLSVKDDGTGRTLNDEQVTLASEAVKKNLANRRKAKIDKQKLVTYRRRTGGPSTQKGNGTLGGFGTYQVPPIMECLRQDGSLFVELHGEAEMTAAVFLEKKKKLLGKRQASKDTSITEGSQSFILKFRANGGKKSKGEDNASQEVHQGEKEEEEEKEATSHGAAGQEEHACQEP